MERTFGRIKKIKLTTTMAPMKSIALPTKPLLRFIAETLNETLNFQ